MSLLLVALAAGGLWGVARLDPRAAASLGSLREQVQLLLGRWFPPDLPLAEPYALAAASDGALQGVAPNTEAAVLIRRAVERATGAMPACNQPRSLGLTCSSAVSTRCSSASRRLCSAPGVGWDCVIQRG